MIIRPVRFAFSIIGVVLAMLFPFVFVVVLVITTMGQLGMIPNIRLTKTKALRSEILVRLNTHTLDGSSIASASIAAKKRMHLSRKKRTRARENWKRAYFKARILQAIVAKYTSKQGTAARNMKFPSEEALVQRARALGLFEAYKGDFMAMQKKLSMSNDKDDPVLQHSPSGPTYQPGQKGPRRDTTTPSLLHRSAPRGNQGRRTLPWR